MLVDSDLSDSGFAVACSRVAMHVFTVTAEHRAACQAPSPAHNIIEATILAILALVADHTFHFTEFVQRAFHMFL
jgi:hypothetical protein